MPTVNNSLIDPEPQPLPNEQPAVWDLVIADMSARDGFGRAKYGTPLQPFNGRDALKDAYQEVLDLTVYLRQAIAERECLGAGSCDEAFILAWQMKQNAAQAISREKGWWENDRNDGEMIALMHSELSEALEGLRHGNPASDHIPEYSAVEEELADVVIRIMDYAAARHMRVAQAVIEKMKFNRTRPAKHGGKRF